MNKELEETVKEIVERLYKPKRRAFRPREVCESLGISRATLTKLIRDGEIESIKIGKCRRITPEAIDRYIAGLLA